MQEDGNSLVKGTLILALAGLLSRGFGSIYRILLPRFIGAEGVGLYHMAHNVFTLALFLVTPGLPLAMSRLIALARSKGKLADISLLFKASFFLLLILSIIASLFVYYSADYLAHTFFKDLRVSYPLQAIAPALFFVGLVAAFRGLFQGYNKMLPTAISQVLEQIVRISVLVLLLSFMLEGPVEGMAVGAALACVCGEFAAFLCMAFLFLRSRSTLCPRIKGAAISVKESYKALLAHALPVSLAGMVVPLMGFLNSAIIPRRLQTRGLSLTESMSLYGQYSGMALALFYFPLVLISALAVNLVPRISELFAQEDFKGINQKMMRAAGATIQLTMPAAVGYMVMGPGICDLFFGYREAGTILACLAPSLVFLSLQLTLAGVLQGLGQVLIPFINLLIGALANGLFTYILTACLGINGAAIGMAIGYVLSGGLNIFVVSKKLGMVFDFYRHLFLPLVASTTMGLLVFLINVLLEKLSLGLFIETIVPIVLGIIYYLLFMIIFKGIEPHDIEIIPLIGDKISSLIK